MDDSCRTYKHDGRKQDQLLYWKIQQVIKRATGGRAKLANFNLDGESTLNLDQIIALMRFK